MAEPKSYLSYLSSHRVSRGVFIRVIIMTFWINALIGYIAAVMLSLAPCIAR